MALTVLFRQWLTWMKVYINIMKKKIDILRELIDSSEWQKAIALAAKFQRLGNHKDAILRAHTAYTNPRFLAQIGRDIEECKQLGINALLVAYAVKH
jgi:hypothetical protein